MSTDTPLTDAAAELSGEDSVVYSEFARKLERTLATKELAETKLRAALKKALRCISVDLYPQLCCEIREALSTTIITDALDSYVDEKVKEATDLIGKRLEFECERAAKLDVRLADLSAASPPLPPQPTEQSK